MRALSRNATRVLTHVPTREYLVPDLLSHDLRLVFCGTAPSKASAAARAYYAKPGNKFWPTLHQIGMTPRRFAPHEFAQLQPLGIGLTDLCKIHCGVDAELPDGAFNLDEFQAKLKRFRPMMVAFTSKNAGKSALGHPVEYGLQQEMWGRTRFYVLPSPSGLATRFFSLGVWAALADEMRQGEK